MRNNGRAKMQSFKPQPNERQRTVPDEPFDVVGSGKRFAWVP
jgi:hypothetical protein